MMRLFRRKQAVDGDLGYFGLGEWWFETFSDEERRHIENTYRPMGIGSETSRPLTKGIVESTTESAVGLLSGLAGWFRQPSDLSIARRILVKAEEIGSNDPLDMHFLYQAMIEIYYRARESDPMALNKAIDACQKQIKLAPSAAIAFRQETDELPAHIGYRQLAIIFEKERKYREAIDLSREAMSSGWAGDWQKRIDRCERKLSSL